MDMMSSDNRYDIEQESTMKGKGKSIPGSIVYDSRMRFPLGLRPQRSLADPGWRAFFLELVGGITKFCFLFVLSLCVPAATDLKLIVGSDMGQEAIDKIFKEFDLNQDGEIDFK